MDFDINKLIVETLKPLDVPVYFVAGKENRFPFIVFNVTSERGVAYWEDEERVTRYGVTFNIFSKGNYFEIKRNLQKLLKEAGFMKFDVPACFYLEDVEVYNQPLEYNYEYIDTTGMCGKTVNRCGKCDK